MEMEAVAVAEGVEGARNKDCNLILEQEKECKSKSARARVGAAGSLSTSDSGWKKRLGMAKARSSRLRKMETTFGGISNWP
jgi:hypothetical protein